MSKLRRHKHQRYGAKPLPNPAQAARPAEAIESVPHVEALASAAEPAPFADPSPETLPALWQETAELAEASHLPALMPVPVPAPMPAPASIPLAAPMLDLTPVTPRVSAESFGTTIMTYVIGEGEAWGAHWRALAGARSMAEIVRLQIEEFQRAADATLTCWGVLTLAAGRTAAPR